MQDWVKSIGKKWRWGLVLRSEKHFVIKDHLKDQGTWDIQNGITILSYLPNACENLAFISPIESKSFKEAEKDKRWINAMQEELNQCERNKVGD